MTAGSSRVGEATERVRNALIDAGAADYSGVRGIAWLPYWNR